MSCFIGSRGAGMVMRSTLGLFFAGLVLGSVAAPAWAQGTVTIQHADGSLNTYQNVAIKVIHNALFVTSSDGKGTMVINRAACSYQGATYVCLPTGVTLVQSGSSQAIDLATGTIYANMTDEKQQLPLSSQQLAPHGILLSISTEKGTYISLTGVIDKVTK